jgi:site-specific DNA-methyltransferase (adenine-specific)
MQMAAQTKTAITYPLGLEFLDVPQFQQSLVYTTNLGCLYRGDCLDILPQIPSDAVNTIFADPPFNLAKRYGQLVNDNLPNQEYINWCKSWLTQCIRILKPGGALFVYNLPKWNVILGGFLSEKKLCFRHWIAVNIKLSLPIPGRLYPSHYSLIYYTKGKPSTFRRIRTPIEKCRHCGGEIRDYGGHRNAMNPNGVNLTDVWNDITPVRHWKFKNKKRPANQLSTKMIERVVQISTKEGDIVLDPFGGSGTTYDVSERLLRKWIGIEIEKSDVIIERLSSFHLHPHKSNDFVER